MTHNIAIYIVVDIGTIVEGDGAMDLTRVIAIGSKKYRENL
jgi:Xaa-Pro aminopeptidase